MLRKKLNDWMKESDYTPRITDVATRSYFLCITEELSDPAFDVTVTNSPVLDLIYKESFLDGALVIINAIVLLHYLKGFDETRSALASVAAILVVGIATYIIGILGCCGALGKKASLLRIYAGIIFLLVVANIICVIVLVSSMDDFKSNVIIGMVIVNAIIGFGVIAAALVLAKKVDSGEVSSETEETSSENDSNTMG
ncbi:hypothetical protein Aperf_G00000113535 [Anoplocephala perfoliata]